MLSLVIHPSDSTTDFLKPIYSGLNCTVINNERPEEEITTTISLSSRVILLGHGTENGLLGWNRLVFHAGMLINLQKNPNNIFIWCHADKFVSHHQLSGFYCGMFISEPLEAQYYDQDVADEQIEYSNRLFASALQSALERSLPPELVCKTVKKYYRSPNNPIIKFNRKRLYFSTAFENYISN